MLPPVARAFNGLGSGLQVDDIVQAIRDAEVAPANARLNRLERSTSEEISALGQFQTSVQQFMSATEALNDPSLFSSRSARLASNDFFSASADDGAQLGNYDIAVQQLATTTKIATIATPKGKEIGEGTLNIAVGDHEFSVEIDQDSNTLAGIRDAINDHEDNDRVTAAVIQDDNGERLVLTSTQSGSDQEIRLFAQDNDGNDTNRSGLSRLNFDASVTGRGQVLQQGQDAKLTVDGLTVTRSSNEISDVVEGVTITVKSAPEGNEESPPFTLRVENDEDKVRSRVQNMVEAYNSLRSGMNSLTNVVQIENSDNITGALVGDSAVRGLERSLNRVLQMPLGDGTATLGSLLDIGIERNSEQGSRDQLVLDAGRLNEALEGDFSGLANLFVGEMGLNGQLNAQIGSMLGSGGTLQQRVDGLQETRSNIAVEREAIARRTEALESRLYAQYQAMDRQVAQYSNTLSFIEAALAPRNDND